MSGRKIGILYENGDDCSESISDCGEMKKVVNKDTESGGVMKDGLINVWWSLKKIVSNSIIQKQRGNLSVDFRHKKYLKNLLNGNLRNHQTMNVDL